MTLLALTNREDARVLRFPLTRELQGEVDGVFEAQMRAFEAHHAETIAFDGRYSPDEGEMFAIPDFADAPAFQGAVENPLAIDAFDPESHSLDQVKALFTAVVRAGQPRILVQGFERRRMMSNRGLAMFFSGATFRKMTDAGLSLDTKLVAILDGDTLKFNSFNLARRVFDLSAYFAEATNEEVASFANHSSLSTEDARAFVDSASPLVRKKIALIQSSGLLDRFDAEQIVASARRFGVALSTTADGKIVLPASKTELRKLLHVLGEDYYNSDLSQTRFISNSKRIANG